MLDTQQLIESARIAAEKSYSPYSGFRVGAALLCADGTVITGANIENRSYGLTNCAERSAIFTAVSAGKQRFTALAVFGLDADFPLPPCGACRQVISEFLTGDTPVHFAGRKGPIESTTVSGLLPFDSLHDLNVNQKK